VSLIALAYKSYEVLCHDAVIKGIDTSLFELICKVNEVGKTVKLASLTESARLSVDGSHRVSRGVLTL
jgi:hypothetical protein